MPRSQGQHEVLARGQTILTANQRAARTLRRAFDQAQQAAGLQLWTPPDIFALDTWLTNLYTRLLLDGAASRLLLNRSQEHALWRGIVAADREVPGLRSPDALAELAADAWRLLCLYNGRGRLRDFTASTDTRAFERWSRNFERLCARNNYVTSAELARILTQALDEGRLPIPDAGLVLMDFDTHPPALVHLFESIRQAGFSVGRIQTAVATESATHFEALDDPAEARAAARWAAAQLRQNAAATVAIVVPGLDLRRAQLERVFADVLRDETLFEFSLGRPLAGTAPIAAALDLLRWPLEPLPVEAISNLLLSPFFGAASPETAPIAAQFDAFELRTAPLLRPELTLEAAFDLFRRSRRHAQLTPLINRLRSLRHTAASEHVDPNPSTTQSHANWADAFRNLLESSGWTRAVQSDSLSFQAHRRWESALDELATLDFDGTRVTASAALHLLTRIARQAIFAPESRSAPIQIMGPLEPGGVPFDALWFLAADDRSWPQLSSVHPFIPWQIQRDLAIPGADSARDMSLAQSITGRLANAATTVVFSFARHAKEAERRPSPLLRALNLAPLAAAPELPRRPVALLVTPDTDPLPPIPGGITHGGSRLLELQAACSFRAFAELRLRSTEPGAREPGFDPRDRGVQVHNIMQSFWADVQSQESLRQMTRSQRETLLDSCIASALARAAGSAQTAWDVAYLNVQRRRLRTLILPWLDFELTRPPFVVLQQEQKKQAQIGPLHLELRADRIDQTAGGRLILDYKTGDALPSQWQTDRPDAPQLPLYAVLAAAEEPALGEEPAAGDGTNATEKLAGVAFALLLAGDDLTLRGFADSPEVLAKPSRMPFPSFDDQVEDWRRVLTSLAFAFAQDDPVTNPKSYPRTCQRCGQRILCRLDPPTLNAPDPEETDDQPALLSWPS